MWTAMLPKLRKEFKASAGYSVIPDLADCATFCYETGQPLSPFGFADETIDARLLVRSAQMMTWGELATRHEAAIYVVCAPLHRDGRVLLVNRTTLMDAEAAARQNGMESVLAGKMQSTKMEKVEKDDDDGANPAETEPETYAEGLEPVKCKCPACGFEF